MKKSLFLVLLLFITSEIFALGEYHIEVSSLGDYPMRGKTFYVVSGNENISTKSLDFKEYVKYVASYIIFNGGVETQDLLNADICVLLNYGIGDSTPIFKNISFSDGDVISKPVDQYKRYIDISAYNNHDIEEMLWKTTIESTGGTNDLRQLFPMMMYVGRNYLGKDSKEKKNIIIFDLVNNEKKNPLMKLVASGSFRNNTIGLPNISSASQVTVQSGLFLIAIQKEKNKTVVLFEYFGDAKVQFSENLVLDQGDGYRKLKPINSSINLTKKLKKNTRYFTIEFDALETDGPIDIIDLGSGIEYVTLETDDESVDIIDSKNGGKYDEFEIEEPEPVSIINPEKIIFWKGIQTKRL